MKQLTLSFLLALLPLMASADPVEINGIWYNLVSKAKQAEVTNMPSGKYTSAIEIPDKVPYDGSEYSVTSIGEYAFFNCSNLTSVTIPNSVTSIRSGAFSGCSDLTSITIPNSVTSIGNAAFSECYSLTSVTIPNGITTIESTMFERCHSLKSITIPNSVKSISYYAFDGCSDLTSVHISDISAWCSIKFSDSSSNPVSYAHHLYIDGKEITDLIIPNSVTSIGNWAFLGCSGLTSVTIPNSVTSIGESAFSTCSGLTSVTIPNSVTSIGYYAFYNCSGLTSITIPNSVTVIENYTFDGCSGLTSVSIPNSVTSIGSDAFFRCSGLTTITIGNGVKTISENAFAQCHGLTDVYCMAEELSSTNNWGTGQLYTDNSAFEGSYIDAATLHVPESAINAYKTTAPWSGFGKFVTLSGEESETHKCATPTISIGDGKIKFSCETEGVEFVSNISTTDTKDYYDAELTLTYKYKVTVYATKDGYENSDTATREIAINENGKAVLVGDVDGDGKVNVADHVELSKIIMGK